MVTTEVRQLTETIGALSTHYQPNEEVAEHIRGITLVPIIGPFAVGKTTCQTAAAELDPAFGAVQSFTTRQRRADEPEEAYHFIEHTPENLRTVVEKMHRRSLVQCTVHPSTGYVYGSEPAGYTHAFATLDTLATAVDDLSTLPFQAIRRIGLVAPQEQWTARIDQRRRHDPTENLTKRLREAVQSLTWLLDQGPELPWVVNRNGHHLVAACEIIGLARGRLEPTPANRSYGEIMLSLARDLVN